MAQNLGKDFLAASISSFQQENEPYQFPASDQEAIYLLSAQENSGGLSTAQGVGKRNRNISCW